MRVLLSIVRRSGRPGRRKRGPTGTARGRWRPARGVRRLGIGAFAALALGILALVAGCADRDTSGVTATAPTGTAPASQPLRPRPSPTPTPERPRPPLPPIVIEVARAFRDGDADRLLQLMAGRPEPCVPPGFDRGPLGGDVEPEPLCPPGASVGTPVGRYITVARFCENALATESGPVVLRAILQIRDEGGELYAVVWSQGNYVPPRPHFYYLVYRVPYPNGWDAGRVIEVSENGIDAVDYGCATTPEQLTLRVTGKSLGREDYLIYPPSEVLP